MSRRGGWRSPRCGPAPLGSPAARPLSDLHPGYPVRTRPVGHRRGSRRRPLRRCYPVTTMVAGAGLRAVPHFRGMFMRLCVPALRSAAAGLDDPAASLAVPRLGRVAWWQLWYRSEALMTPRSPPNILMSAPRLPDMASGSPRASFSAVTWDRGAWPRPTISAHPRAAPSGSYIRRRGRAAARPACSASGYVGRRRPHAASADLIARAEKVTSPPGPAVMPA